MSNVDQRLAAYRDRLRNLDAEKRARAEDIRELKKEMKGAGFSKIEIAGVAIAVRREYLSAEKLADKTASEELADSLGASGTAPLFERAAA